MSGITARWRGINTQNEHDAERDILAAGRFGIADNIALTEVRA